VTADTALAELREMLARAGFDASEPDFGVFWSVWKRFVWLSVEDVSLLDDADLVRFECTLHRQPPTRGSGAPAYVVEVTRELGRDERDGVYERLDRLTASFGYAPYPEFESIPPVRRRPDDDERSELLLELLMGNAWQQAGVWLAQVELSKYFNAALNNSPHWSRIDLQTV
jgi:hypothetical protein